MQRFLAAWIQGTDVVQYTPAGFAWSSPWGSLRYTANAALIAVVYAKHINGEYSGQQVPMLTLNSAWPAFGSLRATVHRAHCHVVCAKQTYSGSSSVCPSSLPVGVAAACAALAPLQAVNPIHVDLSNLLSSVCRRIRPCGRHQTTGACGRTPA